MAQPASTPRWANVGGDLATPTSGKKDIGWVTDEKPPAQWMNYLFYWIYQWILYLQVGDLARTTARKRFFPAIAGVEVAIGSNTWSGDRYQNANANDVFNLPIWVEEGERITEAYARVDPASSGAVSCILKRYDWTVGSPVTVASLGSSSGAVAQTLSATGITEDVVATGHYWFEFQFTTTTGHQVAGGYIKTTRPNV